MNLLLSFFSTSRFQNSSLSEKWQFLLNITCTLDILYTECTFIFLRNSVSKNKNKNKKKEMPCKRTLKNFLSRIMKIRNKSRRYLLSTYELYFKMLLIFMNTGLISVYQKLNSLRFEFSNWFAFISLNYYKFFALILHGYSFLSIISTFKA